MADSFTTREDAKKQKALQEAPNRIAASYRLASPRVAWRPKRVVEV